MSKFKRVILSVLCFCLIVVLGAMIATQYVAMSYGYPAALYGDIARYDEVVLYYPWMLWSWLFAFDVMGSPIFNMAHGIQMASVVVGLAVIWIIRVVFSEKVKAVKPFGEAAWGVLDDAKMAGLVDNDDGVVIGRIGETLLKHNGPEHILVQGSTRSGKGVGIVVPTLWNWRGSAIIFDPKEELWQWTSGYRAKRGDVIYFNPTCENSVSINPLLMVRKGRQEIGDIQNIVQFLSNPNATQEQRDIWEESSKRLVMAVILHVLYSEPVARKNLAVVREKIMDFDKTLLEMMTTPHRLNRETGEAEVHPEVMRVAKSVHGKFKKFKESVAGTAETYLELWADELVAEKTSTNSFDLRDFFMGDKPLTLYLQIPYEDNDRFAPFMRFMLAQITRPMMRVAKKEKRKHSVLLCLEEFPVIGKVPFLQRDLGMIAGYGIKALLVCQSANNIVEEYGRNTTIFDNCYVQIYFASQDPLTQKRMSDMAGKFTEIRESENKQRDKFGWKRGTSVSYSEQTREILSDGDARTLDINKQIIYIGSTKPLKTDKVNFLHYDHLDRLQFIPPPENTAHGLSSSHDWEHERRKGDPLPLPFAEEGDEEAKTEKSEDIDEKTVTAVGGINFRSELNTLERQNNTNQDQLNDIEL